MSGAHGNIYERFPEDSLPVGTRRELDTCVYVEMDPVHGYNGYWDCGCIHYFDGVELCEFHRGHRAGCLDTEAMRGQG